MDDLTYSAGTSEGCHESRHDFPTRQRTYGDNWKLVADDLAEDYNDNHDGWEASWPLELRIYRGDDEVARFEVEKEFRPYFSAMTRANPDRSER